MSRCTKWPSDEYSPGACLRAAAAESSSDGTGATPTRFSPSALPTERVLLVPRRSGDLSEPRAVVMRLPRQSPMVNRTRFVTDSDRFRPAPANCTVKSPTVINPDGPSGEVTVSITNSDMTPRGMVGQKILQILKEADLGAYSTGRQTSRRFRGLRQLQFLRDVRGQLPEFTKLRISLSGMDNPRFFRKALRGVSAVLPIILQVHQSLHNL